MIFFCAGDLQKFIGPPLQIWIGFYVTTIWLARKAMSSMYIVKGIHGYCHFSIKMTILVTKYYKEQKTVLLK